MGKLLEIEENTLQEIDIALPESFNWRGDENFHLTFRLRFVGEDVLRGDGFTGGGKRIVYFRVDVCW